MGEFDKTLDNIREKNLKVVVSNCNITLNNSDDSVKGAAKTFYKMALRDNRVISKFMSKDGGLNIREENIEIDEGNLADFIGNMIQYIEY